MDSSTELIKKFVVIATATVAPLTVIDLSPIFEALLQQNDEQLSLLSDIKANTDNLLGVPYRSGLEWLRSAVEPEISEEHRRRYIDRAAISLQDALSGEGDEYERGKLGFLLSWTMVLSGDRANARRLAYDSWSKLHKSAGVDADMIHDLGGRAHLNSERSLANIGRLNNADEMPDPGWLRELGIDDLFQTREAIQLQNLAATLTEALSTPSPEIFPRMRVLFEPHWGGDRRLRVTVISRYRVHGLFDLSPRISDITRNWATNYLGIALAPHGLAKGFAEEMAQGLVFQRPPSEASATAVREGIKFNGRIVDPDTISLGAIGLGVGSAHLEIYSPTMSRRESYWGEYPNYEVLMVQNWRDLQAGTRANLYDIPV
jgi:hypothetical protein